jgi:hypothetical protein
VLFVAAGALSVAASVLFEQGSGAVALVGVISVLVGVATWSLSWDRWAPSTSIVLAPVALALAAFVNLHATAEPFAYAIWFVIVHVWVGLAHPPRTSLLLSPLTIAAFVAPLFVVAADLPAALASALVVVPLTIATGETVAWVVRRLDRADQDRQALEATLEDERSLLEQLRSAQAQLEFLAFHDPVTGLPNRAFFDEHLRATLASARRRGERVALCVVDLDRFKLVNDTAGHAAATRSCGRSRNGSAVPCAKATSSRASAATSSSSWPRSRVSPTTSAPRRPRKPRLSSGRGCSTRSSGPSRSVGSSSGWARASGSALCPTTGSTRAPCSGAPTPPCIARSGNVPGRSRSRSSR